MPFKLSGYSLLLITTLSYTAPALAESNPPLDFIELLGEMDDDGMLEAALAELAQKQTYPQKTNTVKKVTNNTLTWPHLQEVAKNEPIYQASLSCNGASIIMLRFISKTSHGRRHCMG
jgi:hypothetical protein